MINRVRDWVVTKLGLPTDDPLPASNYMTLVPLSDARLRPRRTKLLVGLLVRIAFSSTRPPLLHHSCRWYWACWQ